MSRQPQIIALGGGGFSMEPENPLLDRYVLEAAGVPRPRVLFVPTASGDSQGYIDRFYKAFLNQACEPAHLSLFKPPVGSLAEYVLGHDVVYVGGGNTRNLLVLWREWGLDSVLRVAWERGIVLCGISAGAICWFEQGLTDSISGTLTPWACLGFLQGSCCPHYDGEVERRPAYTSAVGEGRLRAGLGLDDSAAAHFVGERFVRAVSSRPGARVYRVGARDGRAVEEEIVPEYLG